MKRKTKLIIVERAQTFGFRNRFEMKKKKIGEFSRQKRKTGSSDGFDRLQDILVK